MLRRLALLLACTIRWLPASAAGDSRAFDIDHFQLAVTSEQFLGAEGALTMAPWGFRIGVGLNLTLDPLLVDTTLRTRALIEQRALGNLFGAFALGSRILIGLDLPIALGQKGSDIDGNPGLGDLRLVGRIDVWRNATSTLAATTAVRVPTGSTNRFLGEGAVVVEPRIVVAYRHGMLGAALNLGARFRSTRQFVDLEVGNELFGVLALAIHPRPYIGFIAELHADTPLSSKILSTANSPIEALAGVTAHWEGVGATAAAGLGLIEGYGNPKFRFLLTFTYEKERPLLVAPLTRPPPPKKMEIKKEEKRPEPPPKPTEPERVEVDPAEPDVQVTGDLVELADPIFFDTDHKRIRSRFMPELEQLARAINKRSWIKTLWIGGHADATGPREWNQQLSEQRAEQVAKFLVSHGVSPDRVHALGYGDSKPWFSNAQIEGRAKNRRVVFLIEKAQAVESASPNTKERP